MCCFFPHLLTQQPGPRVRKTKNDSFGGGRGNEIGTGAGAHTHTKTARTKKMAVYDHWFDDLVLYTAMGGLLIVFSRAKKFFAKWAALVFFIYFLFNWFPYIAGRAIQFFVQEAVHRGWLSPETFVNVTRWYGDGLYDRLSGSKTFTAVTTLVGDHRHHNTQPVDDAAASEPPPPPPPAASGGWDSLFG